MLKKYPSTESFTFLEFPSPEKADPSGLLGVGGNLLFSTLISAYAQGIFPWPCSDFSPLTWYSPDPRGLLSYHQLILNRSLKKFLKKNLYRCTLNQAFSQVIDSCAHSLNRKDQQGTWITQQMKKAYQHLHDKGFAYSVEIWKKDDLVGGLYGVCIDSFVSGESMFYREDNASKLALIIFLSYLKTFDQSWLDIQMLTPVTTDLGGQYCSRKNYLLLLENSIQTISSPIWFEKIDLPRQLITI
jgi:leucyl/phenylalanyl-tRNA--protein transferase